VERLRFVEDVPPNGYAWWYADAFSHDRRYGLTVIAFIGSVFSPYYAKQRAGGALADPTQHCAFNIALYGPGVRRWAMTERSGLSLKRAADGLQIGESSIQANGGSVTLTVLEKTAIAGSQVAGTITLTPAVETTFTKAVDGKGRHYWRPIAPDVRVAVQLNSPALSWEGRGYFDMNFGAEPLEAAFTTWNWARVASDRDLGIFYDLKCRDASAVSLALDIATDGTVTESEAPFTKGMPRTAIWQMPRQVACDAHDTFPRALATLEDTPFYSRSAIATRLKGREAHGMHESLSLDRLTMRWVQTLLPYRMPRIA
jgi:carotenoid 1,2-hydratase